MDCGRVWIGCPIPFPSGHVETLKKTFIEFSRFGDLPKVLKGTVASFASVRFRLGKKLMNVLVASNEAKADAARRVCRHWRGRPFTTTVPIAWSQQSSRLSFGLPGVSIEKRTQLRASFVMQTFLNKQTRSP